VSNPLAEASEVIAVEMIRAAFAHLPAERAAGAMAMADTEPIRRLLEASIVEAYGQGNLRGIARGRLELEREMADDWRPIAARVRGFANAPTHEELEQRRDEFVAANYQGGPVEPW
jgi:hypothetical protein